MRFGAFNTPNLESVITVLRVAESPEGSCSIAACQGTWTVIPISVISPIMVDFAKKSWFLSACSWTHRETGDYIKKALDHRLPGHYV